MLYVSHKLFKDFRYKYNQGIVTIVSADLATSFE
jgi:hypothetical protein